MNVKQRYLSPRTVKINVCITEEMHNKILEEAIRDERTLSTVVYRLIKQAMEQDGIKLYEESKRRYGCKTPEVCSE